MKATIVSTLTITAMDGVPVRVWQGLTEGGVPFTAFIHRIAVQNGLDSAEFDQALAATPIPTELRQVLTEAIDPRLVS